MDQRVVSQFEKCCQAELVEAGFTATNAGFNKLSLDNSSLKYLNRYTTNQRPGYSGKSVRKNKGL